MLGTTGNMDLTIVKGMILGMENEGAKFIKIDNFFMYFDIPKGSLIDDAGKIKRAKEAIFGLTGLSIKIRKTSCA